MQTMAQQVLIYRLTGSAVALGIANFMMVVPLVPLALWGGSLSDRLPKRTIVLTTQTLMLLQALVLAWLTWAGVVEVWHVYVMSFLLGAIKAVDMPARHAFVVDMVEGKDDLTNAIGLNSVIYNGARTLGPALAGVAVAALGEAVAFLLNSLSFLAVIGSLVWMRDLPQSSQHMTEDRHVSAHTVEGIRFIFRQQTLLVLMSLVAVSSFLSMPYSTLMPVFANEVLPESAQPLVRLFCSGEFLSLQCQAPEALPLGLLLTAVGLGAVMGALLVASLPERARRGWVLSFGNLASPLCLLIFAVSRSMALSLALMLLVGICYVMQNAVANTLLQIHAPDELRGRVMSLYSLVSQGMTHVGGLQAGFVADWIGAPLSVGLGAAVSLAYGLFVAIRYKRVRELA
jgi:MFS family permease